MKTTPPLTAAASPILIAGFTPAEAARELFLSGRTTIAWPWVEAQLDVALTTEQRAALRVETHRLTDRLEAGACLAHGDDRWHCDDDCYRVETPCLVESESADVDASALEAA